VFHQLEATEEERDVRIMGDCRMTIGHEYSSCEKEKMQPQNVSAELLPVEKETSVLLKPLLKPHGEYTAKF